MADKQQKITMQGFGTPVSAAGQGEQAGPQASSSSDRSSLLVGNLAFEEYNTTRIYHLRSGDQECLIAKRDSFCYICGKYETPKNRRKNNQNIKEQYKNMFDLDMKIDEFDWVPKIICGICSKMLQKGKNGKTEVKMKVPTIWKEPLRKEDCYFCNTNLHGVNSKIKSHINYANVESVTKPIYESSIDKREDPLGTYVSGSMDLEENLERHDKDEMIEEEIEEGDVIAEEEKSPDEDNEVTSTSDTSDEEYIPYNAKKEKGPLTQEKVNELIRDLGLPKDGAEYLASWLKEYTNEAGKIQVSYYRDRDKKYRDYFAKDKEFSLVYCKHIVGLMNCFKHGCYNPNEWRLFIDS
ncbi:uncharacterized protein LOC116416302 [Nasonia vitripennis]|uniref:Uncharacterized protein n=1 Tax=Nasonia vitripennis TaxID=7425 RepID=A0A7M7Q562_NASVI|nr:uncharacterized protein LOC116416302 [Nasonia vitripennis]